MELGLGGKTALITGGSKGIGLATAKAFAAEGVSLHLAARDLDDLNAAREAIENEYGVSVKVHAADLSETSAIEGLAAECCNADILVNNAGAIAAGSLAAIDDATWRKGWDLKVFGYINIMRAMYQHMKARSHGVIINVCGTAGNQPAADHVPATTANSALITLTRAVGGTSLDDGIRVVGINPGDMVNERGTMFLRRYAEKKWGDAERWKEMMDDLPGGRAATSEDMANAMVFFASERAGYVNGVVLSIDGGLSARQAVI